MKKLFQFLLTLLIFLSSLLSILSCTSSRPILIWTDRPEIVSYVEFFNVAQNKTKAVVVYKDKLAASLPPAKDEQNPDIVIGSYLRNSRVKKNFISLDRIFNRNGVNPASIYASLLEYGKINGRQYLIPISFNLPTMIYSSKNQDLLSSSMLIDIDEIRDAASLFNQKSSDDVFVKMGFAPSWNADFIYQLAKIKGTDFGEKGSSFSWENSKLNEAIAYVKNWSAEKNDGTQTEQDFSFKYLYAPDYKLVSSDRCLFAYTSSNFFFNIDFQQTEHIDFKWLSNKEKVFVKDGITMIGLYRKSKNTSAAYQFIEWFLSESAQKNLIERSDRMNLGTKTFGICNGFSSIKSVNERIFPAYYKNLLGKLPSENSLIAPLPLSSRWESLKEKVIVPYLADATNTDSVSTVKSIDERILIWRNQFN